jgi:alkylhydroperoxidase family enzyme
MPHLEPLGKHDVPELAPVFELYERTRGFVPNSLYTMARRPEILRALSDLITAIWRTGTVPVGLKPLLAIVASTAAGCRYCQAHEAVDARVIPALVAYVAAYMASIETIDVVVEDKSAGRHHRAMEQSPFGPALSPGASFLVYSADEVFKVDTDYLFFEFASAERYNSMKVGQRYTVTVTGRNHGAARRLAQRSQR